MMSTYNGSNKLFLALIGHHQIRVNLPDQFIELRVFAQVSARRTRHTTRRTLLFTHTQRSVEVSTKHKQNGGNEQREESTSKGNYSLLYAGGAKAMHALNHRYALSNDAQTHATRQIGVDCHKRNANGAISDHFARRTV
jgi:hypothetical protein